MEPAVYRGDLLFLYQSPQPFEIGEITVYNVGREIPIVHRLLNIHEKCVLSSRVLPFILLTSLRPDDAVELLTRGDNNEG